MLADEDLGHKTDVDPVTLTVAQQDNHSSLDQV